MLFFQNYFKQNLKRKRRKKIVNESIFQESDGDKSDQDLVVDIANETVRNCVNQNFVFFFGTCFVEFLVQSIRSSLFLSLMFN